MCDVCVYVCAVLEKMAGMARVNRQLSNYSIKYLCNGTITRISPECKTNTVEYPRNRGENIAEISNVAFYDATDIYQGLLEDYKRFVVR